MNYYIYLVKIRSINEPSTNYCVRLIINSDERKFIIHIPPRNMSKKFFGVRGLKNLFNVSGWFFLPYYTHGVDNLDEEGVYNIVSSVLYMREKENYKIDIIRKEKR